MSVRPYPPAKPYGPSKLYEPLCDDEPDLWDLTLPEESLDDLIQEPVSFLESAEMLRENLTLQFSLCVRHNRYSGIFLDSILHLLKVMKEFASICVTKAVLEQDGERFPAIEDMNPAQLYFIASMLFRKIHEAARMHIANESPYAQKALSAEIGLYGMLNRLKVTEERIKIIHEKKIDSEKILACERTFGVPAGSRARVRKEDGHSRRPASYPVQKRFLKKKEEDKNEPKIPDAAEPKPRPASTPMEKAVNEMKSEPELVKTDFAPGGIPKDSPWLKIFAEGSAPAKTEPQQPSQPPEQKQTEKTEQTPGHGPDRKRKKKKRGGR